MTYRNRSIVAVAALLMAVTPLAAQSPYKAKTPLAFPSLAEVGGITSDYLESLTDREEDDLLSRGDVAPLFRQLEAVGWKMADARDIEQRLLADSDWLVRTLRTTQGARFMRDMSAYPGGYDRLDRMRQLPHGQSELQGLINSPGGAELIQYLTTTPEGRRTGADLSGPGGRGAFNTPTDRLYTKADVYRQIKQSYAAEAARRLQEASALARWNTNSNPAPLPHPQPKQNRAPAESAESPDDE